MWTSKQNQTMKWLEQVFDVARVHVACKHFHFYQNRMSAFGRSWFVLIISYAFVPDYMYTKEIHSSYFIVIEESCHVFFFFPSSIHVFRENPECKCKSSQCTYTYSGWLKCGTEWMCVVNVKKHPGNVVVMWGKWRVGMGNGNKKS